MFAGFETYKEAIDRELRRIADTFPSYSPQLSEAMRYSLLSPGKRVRGIITLLAAEALGAPARQFLPVAVGLEAIHAFSLVHDDLPALDNDEYRRGRPTTHVVYGEAMALLAGDALLVLGFEEILRAPDIAEEHKAALAFRLAYAAGARGMTAGQALDIVFEGARPTPEEHRLMNRLKTGCLFGFALSAPAVVLTPESVEELDEIGSLLGVAFQFSDDILDATGTLEALRKPTDSDTRKKKPTAVALYGLEKALRIKEQLYDEVIVRLSRARGSWETVIDLVQRIRERTA